LAGAQPSFSFSSQPSFELTRLCLVWPAPEDQIRRAVAQDLDWDEFADICSKHAVRPFVHRALAFAGWNGVPPPVRESLQDFVTKNNRRNVFLSLELARIMSRLKVAGIPSATFKGPALAEAVYGGVGLREFVDLDIVVHEPDLPRICLLLAADGYQTEDFESESRSYRERIGQAVFRSSVGGFAIDLHWKMAPFGMPFPFSDEELWEGLQPHPLAGSLVPGLSPEHLALFLAFHGAKERWRSLKWINDFAVFCRAWPSLDWEKLQRRSALNHCSRELLIAAGVCHALGLTAPPVLVAAGQDDRSVRIIVRQTIQSLVAPRSETDLSVFLYSMATTERLREKAAVSLSLLTTLTVSDFDTIRLPRRLRWLYYLIRPFRLAGKAMGLLVQRFRDAR
jgi:putative nucleotidyltransferase-like protein